MRRFSKAGVIWLFGVLSLLVVGMGIFSTMTITHLMENARWVAHTQGEMLLLDHAISDLLSSDSSRRAFIATGDKQNAERLVAAGDSLQAELRHLRELTINNQNEQDQINSLDTLISLRFALLEEDIARWRNRPADSAARRAIIAVGRDLSNHIQSALAAMRTEEERLLRVRDEAWRSSSQQTIIVLVVGFAIVVGTFLVVYSLLTRQMQTLKHTEEALKRARDELEIRVQERTSELEHANEELSHLAAIVASSDDAIIGKNLEGIITSWNRGAERIYGYSAPEVIGRPIDLLCPPDHVDEVEEILPAIREGRSFDHIETVRIKKDGTRLFVSLTISPLRERSGTIIGASIIARDITERKHHEEALQKSEQQLTNIIASAMDAIITLDEQQRIILFNKAAEMMFRTSAAGALGQPIDEFVPHRYREAHRRHIGAFGATSVTKRTMGNLGAVFGIRRDGEEFPIEASISQVESGGRKLYTVILRDITERYRAEEEIRNLNQELEKRVKQRTAQLEAANRELEAFSYSVSHDLRAPLRHIDGFVQLLEQREHETALLDETSRRYMATIRQASQQMGNLIDELLAFSRSGRTPIKTTTVDMSTIVNSAIEELCAQTAARSIRWTIDPLPSVRGDATMLGLVWVNLLANAVKFTRPRAEARIQVGAAPTMNGEVTFFVRDNGVGFDMQYADKLFGVFQRLHRQDEFEGTGIGLANVRRIVERHGGKVWAESTPDNGATFLFSLPASKT